MIPGRLKDYVELDQFLRHGSTEPKPFNQNFIQLRHSSINIETRQLIPLLDKINCLQNQPYIKRASHPALKVYLQMLCLPKVSRLVPDSIQNLSLQGSKEMLWDLWLAWNCRHVFQQSQKQLANNKGISE